MPNNANPVTTIELIESVEAMVTVGPESAYYLSIILDRIVRPGEPFDLGEVAINNPNVNLEHIFSRPLKEQAEEIMTSRKG